MSDIRRFSQQFNDYGIVDNAYGEYCLYRDYQALEAELLKKLEAEQESFKVERAAHIETLGRLQAAKQRAEAAEARIKASQEQEPVAYATDWEGSRSLSFHNPKIGAATTPLYKQPSIPPELAELQRDKETAMRLVTKTIAENESVKRENAELRKLLEENKVPEDVLFRVVEVAHMAGQRNQGHCDPSAYEALVYWNVYKLQILDLLGIKPQPKEPKQ